MRNYVRVIAGVCSIWYGVPMNNPNMTILPWTEIAEITKQELVDKGYELVEPVSIDPPRPNKGIRYVQYPGGFVGALVDSEALAETPTEPQLSIGDELPYEVIVEPYSYVKGGRSLRAVTIVRQSDSVYPSGRVSIDATNGVFELDVSQTPPQSQVRVDLNMKEKAPSIDANQTKTTVRVSLPDPKSRTGTIYIDLIDTGDRGFNRASVTGKNAAFVLSAAGIEGSDVSFSNGPQAHALSPAGIDKLIGHLRRILGADLGRPLDKRATARSVYENMRSWDFSLLDSLVFRDTAD